MRNKGIDYNNEKAIKEFKEGKPKEVKGFRLAAKKLFLTYPKCNLGIKDFKEQLEQKLSKYGIREQAIVIEDHEDGTPHIHAYYELEKKTDIKKEDKLDILNKEGEIQHGNYAAARSGNNSIEYLMKEVDIENDIEKERLYLSIGIKQRLGKVNQVLNIDQVMIKLAEEGQVERAMNTLKQENPRRYLKEAKSLERSLQEVHMRALGCRSKYPISSFLIPPRVRIAADLFKESFELKETKVFVLVGEPNSGKTVFALSLLEQEMKLKVLIVSDKEDLAFFNPEVHTGILFDDPDFSKMTREQIINMIDNQDRIIKIRYTHARITRGVARVITSNKDLGQLNENFKDQAILRRMIITKIPPNTKLYDREKTKKEIGEDKEEIERIEKIKEHEKKIKEYRRLEYMGRIDDAMEYEKSELKEYRDYKERYKKYAENLHNKVMREEITREEFRKKLTTYEATNRPEIRKDIEGGRSEQWYVKENIFEITKQEIQEAMDIDQE